MVISQLPFVSNTHHNLDYVLLVWLKEMNVTSNEVVKILARMRGSTKNQISIIHEVPPRRIVACHSEIAFPIHEETVLFVEKDLVTRLHKSACDLV